MSYENEHYIMLEKKVFVNFKALFLIFMTSLLFIKQLIIFKYHIKICIYNKES
jgi:hypothetical protein